jgi:hypothetical protein
MYGNTLSSAGGSCGLKTEPLAGKQDDVGPAVHVGSSSSGQLASATSMAATGGASPATTPASISSGATTTPSIVPSPTTGTHSSSRNTTASVTSVSFSKVAYMLSLTSMEGGPTSAIYKRRCLCQTSRYSWSHCHWCDGCSVNREIVAYRYNEQ